MAAYVRHGIVVTDHKGPKATTTDLLQIQCIAAVSDPSRDRAV